MTKEMTKRERIYDCIDDVNQWENVFIEIGRHDLIDSLKKLKEKINKI